MIGFDNIAPARYKGIDMSTVGPKIYEMGEIGVKILVEKIERKTQPKVQQG